MFLINSDIGNWKTVPKKKGNHNSHEIQNYTEHHKLK